jgi:hypothetical protein
MRDAAHSGDTFVRNSPRQSIFAQALERARFFASLMQLTGSEACLPGQPGWLSSFFNLVTLLTFNFVTHPTLLTLKLPCHLIALDFRLK